MRQFKVRVNALTGRRKKIFKNGDIVNEIDLMPTLVNVYIKKGFIEEIKSIVPHNPKPFTEKIKLSIVTGVWKRPEVFEMFAQGIHALEKHIKNKTDIELSCIIAGSEGSISKSMVEKHGFIYIETLNDPLASKMNTTITESKKIGATHVLCLGSDDVVSSELLDKYIEFIRQGYDFIGALDWYFFDTISKKSIYWNGYTESWRKGHTCGAGRILSSELLNKWNWKVWEDKHSKILDNSMQDKLKHTPHSIKTFYLKDFNLFGLDIKSQTNMTPFELWNNCEWINSNIILNKFNYIGLPCAE